MRQIHNVIQSSPEWHAFRAEHFGASEASAVFGLSPYKTRTQLLNEKKTGLVPDVDAFTQKVFDKGHAVEALARPIVENIIGEELSPVTYSFGKLSASCDGLSFMGDIAWENKQFNAAHYEQVKNGELPETHWPQCQQVLHCTGAEKLFFTISDGTEERTAGVWVYPNEDKQNQIIAAWTQFEADLANHVVGQIKEAQKAQAIMALPSLSIAIKGEVTASNLAEFKEAATVFIAAIKTELVTDDDFANAEATAKFCKDAEDNIEATKKSAIAQTASIDELMRTMDYLKDSLRDKRLLIEKLVKSEKENRKLAILNVAISLFSAHVESINADIKPIRGAFAQPDFAGAMKNKKTLTSMQDAVDTCLANAKSNADAIARDIRAKRVWLKENADGYQMLFADIQTIIHKPMDDLQVLVKSRIAEHKEAEAAKEAKIIADANAAALEKVRLADLEKEQAESKQEPLGALDTSSGVGRLGMGVSRIEHVAVGNPTPVQQEQIKQAIQHFQGVEPSVNDLVNAVAKQFGADVMMAHRWLINADFSKYQQAA